MNPPRHAMAEGCCSAIEPCSHQQRDPTTICDNCKLAAKVDIDAILQAQQTKWPKPLKGSPGFGYKMSDECKSDLDKIDKAGWMGDIGGNPYGPFDR